MPNIPKAPPAQNSPEHKKKLHERLYGDNKAKAREREVQDADKNAAGRVLPGPKRQGNMPEKKWVFPQGPTRRA